MEVTIVLLMLPVQEILIYGVAFCTLRSPWMSFQRLPSCLPNRGSQTKFFLIAFIGFCYCPPTSYLCWILHGIWSCCFFRDLLTCQDFLHCSSFMYRFIRLSIHPSIYTLGNRNLYHGSHVHYDFTGNCVLRRTRRYTSNVVFFNYVSSCMPVKPIKVYKTSLPWTMEETNHSQLLV